MKKYDILNRFADQRYILRIHQVLPSIKMCCSWEPNVQIPVITYVRRNEIDITCKKRHKGLIAVYYIYFQGGLIIKAIENILINALT